MSQKQKRDAIKHAAKLAIKLGTPGESEPVRRMAAKIVNRNTRLAAERAGKRADRAVRSIKVRAQRRHAEIVEQTRASA